MKRFLPSILAPLALACALVQGCDPHAHDRPTSPVDPPHDGKGHRVLTGCPIPSSIFGIDHCPIGGATLTVNSSNLTVSNFGPGGNDGVSSSLNGVSGWEQRGIIDFAANGSVIYKAIGNGFTFSTLTIVPTAATRTYTIDPAFTGNSGYSFGVKVYNGSMLQGAMDDITEDRPNIVIVWPSETVEGIVIINPSEEDYTGWTLRAPSGTITVTFPDGRVFSGTSILFTEQSLPGSSRPIDAMEVVGHLDSYVITNEAATP